MNVGDELFKRAFTVDRTRLVRYAGASGDVNPIHYNDAAAAAAGLPGVIAHGMATMGLAATALTDWAGDPGAVLDYGVRFTRPVLVPGDGAAEVLVSGRVGALEGDTVRVDLTVRCDGVTVLARAQALVRRAP
ncbi:MaoC/PaaZ C-terminal domain-containing protein [Georgenia faecalis]|uniref:MaoC/PaaZ C-terminal domain-containing protein n=1 Tax=Georgenia faecalis TaxID=2483799 RepID=UPI000FDB59A0|nr:MaoC/PaaZ C-terminal domain-containing protein [Georgenia faecalis]